MTSPSSLRPTNLKPRELYCESCKITLSSDEPDKKCEKCGWSLITILHSQSTGKRLTGNDELAK